MTIVTSLGRLLKIGAGVRTALFATAAFVAGAALVSAQAQAPDPAAVVATVDGDPITEGDITAMAGVFGEALIDLTPDEQRAYLIDALITLRLMVHAGQAQAMDQEPDFLAQMEQLRQRLLQSVYVGRTVEALVTEEAARARYAELVAARAIPEEVYARHIQVATEAEAYEILRLLADGADFATLAQARSIDTVGGPRGGELCDADQNGQLKCTWARGELIQELDDALFAITAGQVGPIPVQTPFGWHVIKVEERRFQPFEEVAQEIAQALYQEYFLAEVERLRAAAEVVITPVAPPIFETPAILQPPTTPAPADPFAPAPAPADPFAPAPTPAPVTPPVTPAPGP